MVASTARQPGLFIFLVITIVIFSVFSALEVLPPIHFPDSKNTLDIYPEGTSLEMDITSSSTHHASYKHGIEASMARECSGRPEMKFYNPVTKRTAYMCIVEGYFGFHILNADGDEVTAFLKNKMHKVDQVIQYMRNAGYELLQ